MAPRWTISDVAREARVSKTTVSRVLNDRPDVDAETSARVREVVRGLGYVQSIRAVQLARGRSNAVGVLAPFDMSPWLIEVLRGAMAEVHATDFSLTLHAFPETESAAERFGDQLRSGLVDALLVVSLQQPLEIVYRARRSGLPVIYINDFGFNREAPAIAPNDAVGITEAVDHLIAVGRRRFAMIAGTTDYPVSDGRQSAYRSALAAYGIELDDRLVVVANFTEPAAHAATHALVERGLPFDALFASSDAMAFGAMRALRQRNLRIPDDISLVGFDDFPAAEFADPRLTTVRYPLYEMSSRAIRRLIGAARGGQALDPGSDVVTTHLVVRDSSDPRKRGQQGRK